MAIKAEQSRTGYPHIDRPWLAYFSEDEANASLPQGTMTEYMYACNENRLDSIAINYFGKKTSYRELQVQIEHYAQSLLAAGVKQGDYVGMCLLAMPENYYIFYALNKIGASANYIVMNGTAAEINRQLSECNVKIVFTIDTMLDKMIEATKNSDVERLVVVPISHSAPLPIKIIIGKKNKKQFKHNSVELINEFLAHRCEAGDSSADANTICAIEHTGGTTGEAKGVIISNQAGNAIAYNYLNASQLFYIQPGDRFLNVIPPFFAYGLFFGAHVPLCCGCEVILSPNPAAKAYPAPVCKYKPHHFAAGAMHIDALMASAKVGKMDFSFVSTLAYGGDKMSEEWEKAVENWMEEHNAKYGLQNGYGMTEMSGAFASNSHYIKEMIPFAKNNVRVKDIDTGEDLKYGEEGAVCVSGPSMMQGYLNNQGLTQEIIWEEDGVRWLHTGDLGYVTEEGFLVISGRIKRVLCVAGRDGVIFRLYPMKIESVISKHPNVFKCSVVGKPDGKKSYLPIAFIALSDQTGKEQTLAEIRELCETNLPETSWPREYRVIDELPATRAGKIDYRRLEKMVLDD